MTFGIFGLMLGVFWPSAALEAAVKFEASVKNDPFTGPCFEQLSFSPDRQPRLCLLSHLYQNMGLSVIPSLPFQAPSVYHHTDLEQIGGGENLNG